MSVGPSHAKRDVAQGPCLHFCPFFVGDSDRFAFLRVKRALSCPNCDNQALELGRFSVAIDRMASIRNAVIPKNEDELADCFYSADPEARKILFVSTAKAADSFGVSQRTIQLWIERGSILAIRTGRNYKVYLPDIKRYMDGCRSNYARE
jgi:excisionase family DNA binding protein